MNIQPLCSRIRLETCDFERRKRMWQTGLAQAMYKPPVTNSIPRIIEMRLLEPITREFCRKTGSGYPFSSIVPKQTFCSYIPSQSVHRQSVHPIPERKREAGLPAERAAKYGRNQFVPPGAVSQMTFPG